ncbi:hypothetical protein ACQY0O_007705 [Thecaphora frezii]
MLRELFYYLLGGFTFLPLCFVAGLVHFYLTTPAAGWDSKDNSIPSDVELTQEQKIKALDLAAANAALLSEIENSKGKDRPQGSSTVPAAAKRLGPAPTPGSRPHLSGWLTVRPRFEPEADPAAPLASSAKTVMDSAAVDVAKTSNAAKQAETNPKPAASSPSVSYVSQMYKGLLDYRGLRAGPKKPSSAAGAQETQARSDASRAGASVPDQVSSATSGKESFHCILKAPILYLYSSDDVSDPNTECHAAIDLRGKRISIFVSGLGDTMGEPDSEEGCDDQEDDDGDGDGDKAPLGVRNIRKPRAGPQPDPLSAIKNLSGPYDTPSSAGSDAEAPTAANRSSTKFARAGWKRAKRAAVRDGELFMKRNAIRILGSGAGRPDGRTSGSASDRGQQQRLQWFVFCKSTTSMEDWYHALLQASFMPESTVAKTSRGSSVDADKVSPNNADNDPLDPVFSQEDMASLLVSLDSLPDPIPLRWLNAMVGRIFFSVYRTAWLEDYITRKMMKKISRVKTPGFLGDIKVQEVDVGRRPPGFSRPMLKSLTSEGEASMEVACHYVGEIRITIATTLTISLGSRFKPYTIPLVLAVVLRSLEGNLLLQVKPPPSNRLWFGFTSLPRLEIDVEPVVSERKVQWGMVTRLIEGRIRELLNESIVVPNMDDVPFFDTRDLPYRGAIFADAAKRANNSISTAATSEASKSSSTDVSAPSPAAAKAYRSAPASGAATPVSSEAGINETADDKSISQPTQGTSTATAVKSTANPRNRAGNTGKSFVEQLSQQRVASPAAAGLSNLLSRDLAAGGGFSTDRQSTGPSRSDVKVQQQQNLKSWFGTTSRSSSTSDTGSMVSSTPAKPKGGKGREQSSLAWGNASLSHVPSRSTHQSSLRPTPSQEPTGSRDAQELEGSNATEEPPSQAALEIHKRNNKSTSSTSSSLLGTDESGPSAATDELNASVEAAPVEPTGGYANAATLPYYPSDRDEMPTPTTGNHQATDVKRETPSLVVSTASEDSVATRSIAIEDQPHRSATKGKLERDPPPLGVDGLDQGAPSLDSPSSQRSSGVGKRSSSPSLHGDQGSSAADTPAGPDKLSDRDEMGDTAFLSKSLGASTSTLSGYDGSSVSRMTSSPSASGGVKSTHGFAPPPRRTPAPPPRRENDTRTSELSSGLTTAHQSRYGLGDSSRESATGSSEGPASTTAAMLLNSWTKAKASMADKESRQAAAKDAKDAIKRGWASWNAKRGEKADGAANSSLNDAASTSSSIKSSLLSASSSRFSLTASKPTWYSSSSPPDPTSLGTGLEREGVRYSDAASEGARSEAEQRARLRQGLQEDNDDGNSTRSSSSGRQPYHELRASKAAQHTAGRSVESKSESGLADMQASARWSAEVPSLAAPAPALQRKSSEQAQKSAREQARDVADSSMQGETAGLYGSSLANGLRRRVSSTTSNGAGGGMSFMPPAPTTTTSLASTSGFSDSGLSPTIGASPADGNTPLQPSLAGSKRGADAGVKSAGNGPDKPTEDSSHAYTPATRAGPEARATLPPPLHDSPHVYSTSSMTSAGLATPTSLNTAKVQIQPGRAPMMAVPGIPTMQKSIPQSFSAPPPTESASAPIRPSGSPSANRMGSVFKLPMFGTGPEGAKAISITTPSALESSPGTSPQALRGLPVVSSEKSVGYDGASSASADAVDGLGPTNLDPAPVETLGDREGRLNGKDVSANDVESAPSSTGASNSRGRDPDMGSKTDATGLVATAE